MTTQAALPIDDLKALARSLRIDIVRLSHGAHMPHLGSSLSCLDLLVAAYWGGGFRVDPARTNDPGRDRIILSKGHAASALYTVLARRGLIPPDTMGSCNREGSVLAEHPGAFAAPGIELATGSLGHGLPVALGMALASRIRAQPFRVLAILGDGECNEGSVWEAALLAPRMDVGNLTVAVDFNGLQATGRSTAITALSPLADKWRAFGWRVSEIDGHDYGALLAALGAGEDGAGRPPHAVIAHTVKGRGVSFMEDDNNWHYRIPSTAEVEAAGRELDGS